MLVESSLNLKNLIILMSNRTQTLILALQDSIDKLGIETTIENLKLACTKKDRSTKDFIIYQVCNFYKVEMESLKSTTKNKSMSLIRLLLITSAESPAKNTQIFFILSDIFFNDFLRYKSLQKILSVPKCSLI